MTPDVLDPLRDPGAAMESTTVETDTRFGFTWGETEGVVWMWDGDDGFKKVDREFLERLRAVARGDRAPDEMSEKAREAMAYLRSEGFIEDDLPIERYDTPEDVALWPRLLAFAVALVVAATVAFLEFRGGTWRFGYVPGLRTQLLGISVFAGTALLHEAGHYHASRPYFEPSVRFGLLNGIFPAFITRTDGAWMLPRNTRLWINLAGPFVDLLATVALALVHRALFPSSSLLSFLVLLLFGRALFVLNPLVDGDGYWLLTDALGLVNLRSRGKADLRARRPTWPAAYVAASYGFTAVALVFVSRMLARMLGLSFGLPGPLP